MDTLIRIFKKLQDIINAFMGATLVVIMCVILMQTFTRYVIFYSLPWSEELSRYLFVVMILLGINIGISQNLMVRIDLIDHYLPGKAKKVFEIARQCVALGIASVFFYSTIEMVQIGKFQKSPAMQIPMNIMYTVLFIGFLLAVLSVVVQLIGTITNKQVNSN